MNSETIIEVANTLIGFTEPIGDFYKDGISYENQEKLIELTKSCVEILINNAKYKDRKEYTAERIGKKAQEALFELYDEIKKCV